MANQQHLALLKQGIELWNEWRKENPDIRPDLSEADLAGVDLTEANLAFANLNEADLTLANLKEADLTEASLFMATLINADLRNACLASADLSSADLTAANLAKANLSKANLTIAVLAGAELIEAELTAATLVRADFSKADLREANLSKAALSKAILNRANLTKANLRDAILNDAALRKVDLSEADLAGANLSGTDLTEANLARANLTRANLNKASLVETNLSNANIIGCSVYGISAWNVHMIGTVQSSLIITLPSEPSMTVDNLDVAQFLYLLLDNRRFTDVFNTITSKLVLILGRFTPERRRILDAIRNELRKLDYLPTLFDFEKPDSRDLTETVRILAGMSRFIIADISDPSSIPQELQAIVPDLLVPVQLLLEESKKEYAMFPDLFRRYPWVLPIYRYKNLPDLLASFQEKIIKAVEQKAKELERRGYLE